ncbi:MAG: peptidylprolyl isomerase, partial [Calditrichaceae bacterium]
MYKFLTVIILLISLTLLNNCGLSDDTVAQVGNQKIKLDEFKEELRQRFPNEESMSKVDSGVKMQVLNQLIDKKRKLAAAYDMGVDDNADLQEAINKRKEQAIFNKYIENMVVDSVIDLAKVDEYLEKSKFEVKASHILIKFGSKKGTSDSRTKEDAEKLATSLAERIKNGESINDLALEYSDDPSAKKNKGDLGYFTWGRMVDEFQEAAFSLAPGQVSDPVLTSYGYHIIQVNDRRDNPRYNPENERQAILTIKRKLYSQNQGKARQRWTENGKNVRNEFNYNVNEQNIVNLVTFVAGKNKGNNLTASDFTDEEKDMVLAKFDGGEITVDYLLESYKNNFRALIAKLKSIDKLKQECENLATNDMIKIITQRENYDQDPDIKQIVDQITEQQMISYLNKEVTKVESNFSDEELLAYYEAHPDEFKQDAEIEIWEIYVKDENLAKRVARLAKSGKDFVQLEKQYNEDKSTKKLKGYLGFRSNKHRGAVSKKAFEIGPDKIEGPIKYRRGYAIIKTGQLKPESIKPFENVKSQVMRKLKREQSREQRKEWS